MTWEIFRQAYSRATAPAELALELVSLWCTRTSLLRLVAGPRSSLPSSAFIAIENVSPVLHGANAFDPG